MTLFKYLAANWFHIIGGLLIGLGLPVRYTPPLVFEKQGTETVVFLVIGILLIGVSVYYKFIDKEHECR